MCVCVHVDSSASFTTSFFSLSLSLRGEQREREREKCSLENGKMLLENDVLALARASTRKEEMMDSCYPFSFKCCVSD